MFQVKVDNPFTKYLYPDINDDSIPKMWNSNPIQFYQNQINFAVFCATTGCGVSYVNHLNHSDEMIKSIYLFHFYFQVRRILSELQVPMPTDKNFHPYNNLIDLKAYQRICNEFNIDTKTDFRQVLDRNHGLGTLHLYAVGNVYDGPWGEGYTSFDHRSPRPLLYIQQTQSNAWTTFILDTSNGFTRSGVERLNESIRTYVYCVLGAQAQTRTNIIGEGTSFDAQKQFLANVEDSINSAVDLPSSIRRYQDVLKYARSKVDFVVGFGLYMLPSDLQLQIGSVNNYNNEIMIANESQILGLNPTVNTVSQTLSNVPVKSAPSTKPLTINKPATEIVHRPTTPLVNSNANATNNAMTLSIGLIAIGLLALYVYE